MTDTALTPVHVQARILTNKSVGAFRHLTLVAPGVGDRFRPGNFLAVSVGSDGARLARRAFWIHRVRPTGGHGLTVEVVVEPTGPGTRWLARQPADTTLQVTGPLGRPYAMPKQPVRCLLVGEGHSAAPLFTLAERLRDRDCSVTLLVGAVDEAHLLSALEARRVARAVTIVTQDGSVGRRGHVREHVREALTQSGADVVYAAGDRDLLHEVAAAAEDAGAWSQVGLETQLICGTGLCEGCAVPIVGEEGAPRSVRACFEGPVIRGDRIRWDALP
ncbi:MAG: hypothetical protein V9G04_08425 [Nocardioides sp.]